MLVAELSARDVLDAVNDGVITIGEARELLGMKPEFVSEVEVALADQVEELKKQRADLRKRIAELEQAVTRPAPAVIGKDCCRPRPQPGAWPFIWPGQTFTANATT